MQRSSYQPGILSASTSAAAIAAENPTKHTLQPALILRTKLLAPRPAPALLARPRLTARLQANLAHPVTLVTANAGSGKTTLVAEFLQMHDLPFVWYQLDRTDADPLVFLGYLTHGIRQAVPRFGEATLAYLQQAATELLQQPERAVDVLLNEVLDHAEQQLVVVLDDYHHLGADTGVHRIVERLLAYLPDMLHFIIISRDVPPLALVRLRTQSSLTIIDRTELLFTDDETQQLFRNVFGLELTPEQLTEYRARTEGWITALQLIRQVALQRQALAPEGSSAAESAAFATDDLTGVLRQSERDIFDYFAEEVFADEPPAIQRFLVHISLLDAIELTTCSNLYPDVNCRMILPALVRRNVFITLASDGRGEEYRLHPLFQGFLRRRLQADLGQAAVADEHTRVANYFLEREQWERAMRHLLAAEDFTRAAAVIADKGARWIAAGTTGLLVSFSESLPLSVLKAHPRTLVHLAEVARLQGEYAKAQRMFRRAAILLNGYGDREGAAEAFRSLAAIARQHGDFATTFDYLDQAVALTNDSSLVRIKCGNTRGLCLMAMGEWAAAEREFRFALQSAEDQGDDHHVRVITHNLGLPALMRGDFNEALGWFRRMLHNKKEPPPVPQGYLNVARCLLYRGDMNECERHLDQALECCQLFNLVALRGEIFETYGNLYREQGDAQRAAEFYERAARAYDEAGIELVRRELFEEQALLNLQLGDVAAARLLIDQLISSRAAAGDEQGRYTAALTYARIMLKQGENEAACSELIPAAHYFRSHGLYYYEAQASIKLATCHQALGRDVEMLANLGRALELAARYDYEYWLQRHVANNPRLFLSPEALALLPAEIREQLQGAVQVSAVQSVQSIAQVASAEPAAAQLAMSQPGAELTINMLGPTQISRDSARPFKPDAWITKRSRDILCFIASQHHRRASKDTIIDTFWGEADFAVVEKNFHPTISHIRKALNSNQPLKQNFLLYRDGDYLLNPDFSYQIDTEEFDRLVADGEAARRDRKLDVCILLYEEATSLYRGEFMHGCYDEWVDEQRAYYREQYLRMLEALATAAQQQGEWPRSLDLAQRILSEDQFREDVHCMIMRAHAALANRVAVKEQYEVLRRLLQTELGVEPVAETQRIYRESIG